jgi:hypothetical protein
MIMPKPNDNIVCLVIKVTLTGETSFDVLAGDKPASPSELPFHCMGDESVVYAAFLTEILQKIINSYPNEPISLCIDDSEIVPDVQCASRGVVAAPKAALEALAKPAARKAPAPKDKPKTSTPKTPRGRKTTKRSEPS